MKLTGRMRLAFIALCFLLWPDRPRRRAGRDHRLDHRHRASIPRRRPSRAPASSRCTSPRERATRPRPARTGGSRSPACASAGPTRVTATLSGFQPQTVKDVVVNLGVEADLVLTLGQAALTEEVTVTAQTSEVFSAARTGAATTVNREALQTLPTVRDRINDFARLSPAVHGRCVRRLVRRPGQPAQQHHDRRLVLQQLVRPRRAARRPHRRDAHLLGRHRGDPGQRRALRRPPGQLRGRRRQHDHPQRRQPVPRLGLLLVPRQRASSAPRRRASPTTPAPSTPAATAAGPPGPIIKDKLFFFGSIEDDKLTSPGTTFRANTGGETVAGNVTRVLASDLDQLSSYLSSNFKYDTGPYQDYDFEIPARRYLAQARLQPERPEQDQRALHAARLEDRPAGLQLLLARLRQPPHAHDRPQLRELELQDPREHQVRRRRVELDPRQQHVQLADRRLHLPGREPRVGRRVLPDGGHPQRGHDLHDVRVRAVHARTTSCGTRPSRSRTTSPGTAATTRSRSARPRSATSRRTSSSPARRASTSTTRSPTSTPTRTTTWPTRTGRPRR